MLAATSVSSNAFTLSSPSLERPIASLGVEPVWWDAQPGAGIDGVGVGTARSMASMGARCAIAGGGVAPGKAQVAPLN